MLKRKEAGDIFMKSNVSSRTHRDVVDSHDSSQAIAIRSNPNQNYSDLVSYNPIYNPSYNTSSQYNNTYPSLLNNYSYGGYQPLSYNTASIDYLNPMYSFGVISNALGSPTYSPYSGGIGLPSSRLVEDLNFDRNYGMSNFNSASFNNFGGGSVSNPNNLNLLDNEFGKLSMNSGTISQPSQKSRKSNNQPNKSTVKDSRIRVYQL